MRRVYWTADFAEANIVTGLLRANGIDAQVFDAGMAQLDWMRTLAIGGYRIMAVDADAEAARKLVAAYRRGEMELADADADQPVCPNCGARRSAEDRNPRRVVFLLLLLLGMAGIPFLHFLLAYGYIPRTAPWVLMLIILYCALVSAFSIFLLHWMKRRYRCAACASTWQAHTRGFEALSHAVDAAQATSARPESNQTHAR